MPVPGQPPGPPLGQPFGRYELLTLLAYGGMAEVYLARMTGVGGFSRLLVIKRILPHLTGDPDFVEMFLNEGRIAARLAHPNVCHVYELGEVGGALFLAMEYLEGLAWSELSPLIPRDGGFELRCTAAVLGQVCEGLRYAHELRDIDGTPTPVVHRDVSPQNLMVTTDGVCKLLDFGVSKVLTESTRTRTGMLKGKLPYMAPEQIRGEPVDPRADVFSMGTVLWEALTGERLFRRDSDYQIWIAVTEDPIPTVTSRRPGLPPRIDAVVGRALERDVAKRYPTIRAFASDLREVADYLGGPLDQAALAELVRTLGAEALAARAYQVSHALGRPIKDPRPPAGAALVVPSPAAVTSPGDTPSVQLRDGSVRLGRRRRSRWTIAVGALGALGALAMAGGGIAAALWTSEPEPLKVAELGVPGDVPGGGIDAASARPGDAAAGEGMAGDAAADDTDAATVDAAGEGDARPAVIGASDAGVAGAADGPAPRSNDAGVKRPVKHRVASKPPDEPAVAEEPGQYSVDAKPYATIYIDGKSYGETPLFKVPLAPGKHRIRAVREDGEVRRYTVTIEAGKLTSSGTLAW
jgi:eukaryotic-like serine/threonine-protein kinase